MDVIDMNIVCPECHLAETLSPERWRCDCGAAWEPVESTGIAIDDAERSIWRYRQMYGLDFEQPIFQMGTGWTPLLDFEMGG
ncbi:MAG: hypothetical protein K8R91_04270, partial [Phycisphaerae bacterium]|nr:hypothetical protein [Phycisphaerae bacterium]